VPYPLEAKPFLIYAVNLRDCKKKLKKITGGYAPELPRSDEVHKVAVVRSVSMDETDVEGL
jgi:hypothetical protein